MFEHEIIGKKNVYTVSSHHHILEAWAAIRGRSTAPPNLITFDEHTDSLEPFMRHVYAQHGYPPPTPDKARTEMMTLVGNINFENASTVTRAIELLRNDEHIQAATLSGILNVAFVFSFQGNVTESEEEKEYEQKYPYFTRKFKRNVPPLPAQPHRYVLPESRIFIIPHGCRIGCTASPHDDDCHYALSNEVLDAPFLNRQFDLAREMANSIGISDLLANPYILDIDLDFFHTSSSLKPKDPSVFHNLIREAVAVTIAIEAEYTDQCWLDNPPAPIEKILAQLHDHIEAASV